MRNRYALVALLGGVALPLLIWRAADSQATEAAQDASQPAARSASASGPAAWFDQGRFALQQAKQLATVKGPARNVILFVGDGMGVTTVTAARIFEGQRLGGTGEEHLLSFEKLPYTALVKTYETNQQVSDSAGTMTAMVTGAKTKAGLLSVDEQVIRGDHLSAAGRELRTIVERAERAGLSTGVVTTTRVTHATPAACFAHTPERDWECDADLPPEASAVGFPDIARQLLDFKEGDGLDVVLGGGRIYFLPNGTPDPEYPQAEGRRKDGRDLTREWLRKPRSAYAWNRDRFDAVRAEETDHLLGLFEPLHMQFEHDRPGDPAGEPSLSEMTGKAIDILSRNERGFFLMVEGGRIDHAHHATNPYRALSDTVEFAAAVRTALEKTNREDTLVVVTADHSHVMTFAGYPTRGNDILGKVVGNDGRGAPRDKPSRDALGLPYTTLSYANGPGYTGPSEDQPAGVKQFPHHARGYGGITSGRPDLTDVDTASPSFLSEATVPMDSETHGGEDVPLYADGPNAHLFRGVLEQNFIYFVMADALGLLD